MNTISSKIMDAAVRELQRQNEIEQKRVESLSEEERVAYWAMRMSIGNKVENTA